MYCNNCGKKVDREDLVANLYFLVCTDCEHVKMELGV